MTRKSSMALPPSSPAAAGTIVAPHLTQTQSQMVYYPLPSQTLARASPLRPVAPPQPQTPGKALQHQQQYLHGHGQSQQSQQIQVRGTNHHHQAGRPVPPPPPFQLVLSPPICSLPLPMTTNATTTMAETMSMVPSGSAHWQYHQHQQQEPLSSQLLLTMAAPPPPPPPPQLLSSQPQLAPIYASAATLEAIVHSAVTNAMRECAGMLHTRGGGPAAAPLLSAGSLLRDTIEQPYDSLGSITLSQPPYGGTGSSSGLGTQHHHFSLVASQPIVLSHTTPTPTPPPLPPPPGPPLPSSINEPLEADHRVLLAAVLALRAELATTNSPTPLLSPVQLPPGADEATRLADGTASPPDAAHAATVHLARSTVTAVRALVASRARDAARTEKARAERDAARVDRDAARGERDDACKDRDAVCSDHDKARGDLRAAITYIATKNTDFDAAAKNHAAEVLAAATRAAELEGQVANLRAQLAESYAALDLAAERATAAAQAQAASDLEAAVDEERARGSTVAADLRVERDAAVARTSELVAAHESEIAHIHGHLDVARIAERCAADREAVAAAQCSDRESQLQSAQDELANVCRDRNAAQAAEATARTEIERLEGLLKDAERDIHDAAETNAKMWGRVENEESARKELEVQLADEQVRTSTVQSELAGERARASTMESELAEERSRLSTLQSELSDEQARVSALKSEMADAWGRIFTLEKELTQERDWGSARESDLEETKGRLESATSKLVSAERRATEAEADAKSKAAAAADTSAVVEQLRAQVKDLEQQLVAAKQQRPPSTSKRAVFAPGGFDFGLPPPLPLPQMRSAVIDLTGNSADMSAFADGTHEHGSPVPAAAAVTAALVAQRYPPPVSVSSSAANSPNVDSPVPRKRRRVEIECAFSHFILFELI
ncbi:hypothetical protein BC828DRAFT_132431 [Blastocladiella britannica]|nr:hypothetical protein BC828DRAFT_132431 [Blastocladiella britannica]